MRRVLFVAYYFPPLGGIGSVRALNFATHLSEYGWEATVLAPRNGAYHRDATLTFPEERVIRTGSLELSRAGKRLLRAGGNDTDPSHVGGIRALLKDSARRNVYFPDAQIGWYPPAALLSVPRVLRNSYDAVFSTSFPITAHLVARTLHRRLKAPWVAEFRDPWSARIAEAGSSSQRAERLERKLAQEASALVTVSSSWADMFGSAWQRDVTVIPNGHDAIRPEHPGPSRSPFQLGYLGTYYPRSQNLDAVWSAVAALNGDVRTVDAIRVAGARDDVLAGRILACGAGDLVSFTGFLPHAEAIAEMSKCTALIVAGPLSSAAVERGVIAAKIFEYLATNRPVIYVGHPDTDAANLLRAFPGTHIISTGDTAAAIETLRTVRDEVIERDVTALSRRALAGRLAALLNEVSS